MEQLREFGGHGYLVLPGVVPERLLAPADTFISAFTEYEPVRRALGAAG